MPAEVPEDLILPLPNNNREQDIFMVLQDAHRQIAIALQDVAIVGTADTEKVKASSTDPTAGYLDAKVKASIEVDADQIQLVGDSETPGNTYYYGTDASGTKGFHSFSVGSSDPTLIIDTDNDTSIKTETNPDEDIIRITVAGIQQGSFSADGLTLYTGASVNEFSIDTSMSGNSDDAAPTEKAVKAYVDDLESRVTTIVQNWLLTSAVRGDIFTVNRDIDDNLYIDKITPLKYGYVLVDGGPGEIPFWDRVDGAPGALIADTVTFAVNLTTFNQQDLITMADTIDSTSVITTDTPADDSSEEVRSMSTSYTAATEAIDVSANEIIAAITTELSGSVA